MQVEGCVWSTSDDNEDLGCMEDGSEDGTTYWYQMAMCRRAQVAYSLYASSSGSSNCGSSKFVGSYVTQDGLAEFAYILQQYDENSPINKDYTEDLPYCEAGNNGYYLSVGCASDGTFTIENFSDAYCNERVSTYNSLDDINYIIKKNFQSCYEIYNSNYDQYVAYSTAGALISYGKPCTSLDTPLCASNSRIDKVSGSKVGGLQSASHTISNFNIANKAKYAMGTLCLIGSLFMFLGILFTNRRKRRAMMHRKLRAAKRERARRGSSSKSRSGRGSSSRSRSGTRGGTSSRSRSRARPSKSDGKESGVFA